MKSFVSPHVLLMKKVLERMKENPYLTLSFSLDKELYFRRKVSGFFQQKIYFEEKEIREPLPLFSFRYSVHKDSFTFGSFGSSTDRDQALLVTQAELLERTSSWVPLDYARKHEFSREKIQKEYKQIFFVRSLLSFRLKKKNIKEIYWGLAENTGIKKNHITTNGIAGHFSETDAILHAWLELIERDSFLMYWLNTISPVHIDLESIKNEEVKMFLDKFDKEKYRYYALDITSDLGIPTCLAVVIHKNGNSERMAVGASSGFDGAKNIISATKEACVVLDSLSSSEAYFLPKDYNPLNDRRIDKATRIKTYLSPEGISYASFLWSSSEKISVDDFETKRGAIPKMSSSKDQLVFLKNIFKEKYKENENYDVFVFKFKNELTHLFYFSIVRVMCDALYSLYLAEWFADPNHPRLKEFVKNKGLENVAKLNLWPHPFP